MARASKKVVTLAEQYLALHQQLKELESSLKEIGESLREVLEEGDSVDLGEAVIKHIGQDRREFDAEALKNSVSRPVFQSVTETVVKPSLLDSAVKLAKVNQEVVDAITSWKHTSYIKVVVK